MDKKASFRSQKEENNKKMVARDRYLGTQHSSSGRITPAHSSSA
jgi:hypothetical protein